MLHLTLETLFWGIKLEKHIFAEFFINRSSSNKFLNADFEQF